MHELLHTLVSKSIGIVLLPTRRKMSQDFESRTFFLPSIPLKITIPNLLRKCKRDILPLERIPMHTEIFYPSYFLQYTHGSKWVGRANIRCVSPQTAFLCDISLRNHFRCSKRTSCCFYDYKKYLRWLISFRRQRSKRRLSVTDDIVLVMASDAE